MADERTLTMPLQSATTSFAGAGSRQRVMLAMIFAVALLPVLSTPLLPFIDLYNHLARYFVLAHIDASPLLQQNYAANWSLLPNIGLDIAGTLLLRLLPPAYAAHVVVIAVMAIQYGGVLTFNRVLTGRWSLLVAILVVPLLYSFILNWGFVNFLVGLGLVFWAAAWWLAMRDRLSVALPVACLFAVAIFFCHGLTFALYGIFLGTLEIGLFLRQPGRRIAQLGLAMAPLAAQAIVPVLLFALAPTSQSPNGLTNADDAISRLAESGMLSARLWDLFCYRLLTIVRVAEGPSLWFDILAFAATAVLIAVIVRRGGVAIDRTIWPALVVGGVLVAFTPPALFDVGYVADRMPLFLAMIFVAGLTVRTDTIAALRPAVVALSVLVAVRLIGITLGWQAYAADFREFRAVTRVIPPGSLVNDVQVGGFRHDNADPRCAMYRPLLVSLDGQIAPLFANATQQPLRIIGPLRAAMTKMPRGHAWGNARASFYDDVVAAAGPAGFDYLLLCNAAALTRPLPARATVAARSPRFTLLKLDG